MSRAGENPGEETERRRPRDAMPPVKDDRGGDDRSGAKGGGVERPENPWGILVAVSDNAKARDQPNIALWRAEHQLGREVAEKEFLFGGRGISALHCTISRRQGGGDRGFTVYIRDSSVNGTIVNDNRIAKNIDTVIKDRDLVSLVDRFDLVTYRYEEEKPENGSPGRDMKKKPRVAKETGIVIREPKGKEVAIPDPVPQLRAVPAASDQKTELRIVEQPRAQPETLQSALEQQLRRALTDLETARNDNRLLVTNLTASLGSERQARINLETRTTELEAAQARLQEELTRVREFLELLLEMKNNDKKKKIDSGPEEQHRSCGYWIDAAKNKSKVAAEDVAGPSRYRGSNSDPGGAASDQDDEPEFTAGNDNRLYLEQDEAHLVTSEVLSSMASWDSVVAPYRHLLDPDDEALDEVAADRAGEQADQDQDQDQAAAAPQADRPLDFLQVLREQEALLAADRRRRRAEANPHQAAGEADQAPAADFFSRPWELFRAEEEAAVRARQELPAQAAELARRRAAANPDQAAGAADQAAAAASQADQAAAPPADRAARPEEGARREARRELPESLNSDARTPPAQQQQQGLGADQDPDDLDQDDGDRPRGPGSLQPGAGVLAAAALETGPGESEVGNSDTQPGDEIVPEELLGFSQNRYGAGADEAAAEIGPAAPPPDQDASASQPLPEAAPPSVPGLD